MLLKRKKNDIVMTKVKNNARKCKIKLFFFNFPAYKLHFVLEVQYFRVFGNNIILI